MSSEPAIDVRGVSKTYRIYGKASDRFRERLPWNRGKPPRHRAVHALQDVTFQVRPGTCVGLVGGNGAGKSTLLKILTGTTFPTQGSFTLRGRVASLLELGAGFNQNFTGRANVFMNAALLGMSRSETQKRYREICDFSELGDFLNAPVRTYSSGMVCRLGFSVAVTADPDVLIIDEILAVGDMHFRRKCVDRIMDFKKRGKTMFFCSHSLYDVRQICDEAIWMKDGRVRLHSDSVTVTNEYATYENQLGGSAEDLTPWDGSDEAPKKVLTTDADLHARILEARLVDPKTGKPRHVFKPHESVGVRVHIRNGRLHEPLAVAIAVTRADGMMCFAATTEFDDVTVDFTEGTVTLIIPQLKLLSGTFVVPVWLLDARGVHRFHEQPCSENLIVQNRDRELGVFYTEREWRVEVLEPAPQEEPRP